ncbi:hypothetical protein ACFSSB_01480 [Lacinutrix gracilariae]|uniref:Uncharacterized protein n=1 Tax=Lacinutrix gracilariae TaxID=1747198 RepID=A0ABW5JWT9_9FLAO
MITEELIKKYFLTKSKTIKAYLIGNEDKLFLTEDHDHIKNVFKSNKKEGRMIFYRINYFIAVIFLLGSFFMVMSWLSQINNIQDILYIFVLLAPLLLIFLKPLVHLFALKNRRNNKNISMYKELYGEQNFNKLNITSEIQDQKEKGISKGLFIGVIVAVIILYFIF